MANNGQNQDVNPGGLCLESMLLTTIIYYLFLLKKREKSIKIWSVQVPLFQFEQFIYCGSDIVPSVDVWNMNMA